MPRPLLLTAVSVVTGALALGLAAPAASSPAVVGDETAHTLTESLTRTIH